MLTKSSVNCEQCIINVNKTRTLTAFVQYSNKSSHCRVKELHCALWCLTQSNCTPYLNLYLYSTCQTSCWKDKKIFVSFLALVRINRSQLHKQCNKLQFSVLENILTRSLLCTETKPFPSDADAQALAFHRNSLALHNRHIHIVYSSASPKPPSITMLAACVIFISLEHFCTPRCCMCV